MKRFISRIILTGLFFWAVSALATVDYGQHEKSSLLIISKNVQQWEILQKASNEIGVQTLVFDPRQNDLEQLLDKIKKKLDGHAADSIGFVSHNSGENMFPLTGSETVSLETSLHSVKQRRFWQDLGQSVRKTGRIDLFACDLAREENGRLLIATLENLTKRNVAASTNKTGNPTPLDSQYRDWSLETDGIDVAQAYFHPGSIQDFTSELNDTFKLKITASDLTYYDRFGYSTSISGDYAVVSSPWDDDGGNESGAAYVFKRDGDNWVEQAKLKAPDPAAYDFFGRAVSISGDYIVIGSYGDDDKGSSSGSVYVFKRDGTTWAMEAKLTASDGALGDYLGCSVAISGDYLVAGAYGDNDEGTGSGSAYVFKRDGVTWTQQAKIRAVDVMTSDILFGYSVAISGDYVVVGAIRDYILTSDINSGSAHIFKRDGVNWAHQTELGPSDPAAGDEFGCSVAISGDDIVVGARNDDDNGGASGSAYVYKRNGTSWEQRSKLTASDGAGGDYFGCSVSISGDYTVVGSLYDKLDGSSSGSAYVFKRTASDLWESTMKLGGTDTDWYNFGCSVAISNDYALVGARSTNTYSGSAYVFDFKPYLTTTPASSIGENDAVSGGNVLFTGITSVNQRGICWSTSPNPTTLDSKTIVSGTTGEFSAGLSSLTQNTTYYVRAFAINTTWTGYGDEISFTTLKTIPTIQSDNITFSEITSDSMKLQWDAGNGAGRIVVAHEGSAVDSDPVDGINHNANTVFGSGDQIGTGNYVVYMGTGNSVTVTGLATNTTYHFRVYEFSLNLVGSPKYNMTTTATNPADQRTENPTITVNTDAFSANFGEITVGTSSSSGAFIVAGSELQENVTVLAANGFEVSTSSDVGFGASITLSPVGETITASPVYIRFTPGVAVDYSDNITLSSKHANTVTIAVTGEGIELPVIETTGTAMLPVGAVTATGNVVSTGNTDCEVGFCWNTSGNPTIADSKTAQGPVSSAGEFVAALTGLIAETTYYVRAYGTNAVGIHYGEQISFTTTAPAISIDDVSLAEGNIGISKARLTVSLSIPSSKTVKVNYTTSDGTATAADNDYIASSGTLTFAPGETKKYIDISVKGDTKDENTETFSILLSTPVNATIADSSGNVAILSDDQPPAVSLSVTTDQITEQDKEVAVFIATLSEVSSRTVTVDLSFSGTATTNIDYARTGIQITIPPESTLGIMAIMALTDDQNEGVETVTVSINSVTNATEDGEQQQIVYIVDEDELFSLTVNNGTGNGNYVGGDSVPIRAVAPKEKMVFSHWEGDVVYIADVSTADTTITMPRANITITAVFEDKFPWILFIPALTAPNKVYVEEE